jgi:ubiquinone/menaquinone biosynthesis C-methylase UbiE
LRWIYRSILLAIAKEQFEADKKVQDANVEAVQGNLLSLPFPDGQFDAVLTCGALEYVPLDAGLRKWRAF